jgi:hypothetical protein
MAPYASSSSSDSPVVNLIQLALCVLIVAGQWKIFTKAGKPGWAALIPFYDLYVLLKVAGRPGWWLILFLIPLVNLVVLIIVSIDLAKSFGKSTAFGVLALALFPFVGYPMLGFGSATYNGPAAGGGASTAPAAPAAPAAAATDTTPPAAPQA